MSPSTQLAILVTAACLCVSAAAPAPDARLGRKSQRPTRGFKNVEMMTARGFGKRDHPPNSITRAEQLEGYSTPIRRTFNPKTSLMVANGFGKRADEVLGEDDEVRVTRGGFKPNAKILIARGYGKRNLESDEVYGLDNLWEKLENGNTAEREGQDGEEKMESIPTDWFVNEMLNNPDFARSVVRKFIDLDQDGMLSTEELLRNVV